MMHRLGMALDSDKAWLVATNTSLTEFVHDEDMTDWRSGRWGMERFNDAAHLTAASTLRRPVSARCRGGTGGRRRRRDRAAAWPGRSPTTANGRRGRRPPGRRRRCEPSTTSSAADGRVGLGHGEADGDGDREQGEADEDVHPVRADPLVLDPVGGEVAGRAAISRPEPALEDARVPAQRAPSFAGHGRPGGPGSAGAARIHLVIVAATATCAPQQPGRESTVVGACRGEKTPSVAADQRRSAASSATAVSQNADLGGVVEADRPQHRAPRRRRVRHQRPGGRPVRRQGRRRPRQDRGCRAAAAVPHRSRSCGR